MFFSNLEKGNVYEPQRNIINCLIQFQIRIHNNTLAEEYETVK